MTVNGIEYVRKDSVKDVELSDRVIVRCRNAGIHVGTIKERTEHTLTLINSNRIYRWRGAKTLSELAMHGVNRDEYTSIQTLLPLLELTCSDVCEVIPIADGVDLSEVCND